MELRIKLYRKRLASARVDGTLTCCDCGKDRLFMLYDGGVCRSCYKAPKLAIPRVAAIPGAPIQSKRTLALQERVNAFMTDQQMPVSGLARLMQMDASQLHRWLRRECGPVAQQRIGNRIEKALDVYAPVAVGGAV